VALNSLFTLFSWLFPLVPLVLITPFIVRSLGTESYGIYVLTLGFVNYFFTGGIGKAAVKYVAEFQAEGRFDKVAEIISATLITSIGLTLAGTVAFAIAAPLLVSNVLRIPPDQQAEAIVALYLACALILTLTLNQALNFVLQGIQRFDRYFLLTNLYSGLQNAGIVVLLLSGYGMVAILSWTVVAAVVVTAFALFSVKRLLPEYKFSFSIGQESRRLVGRYALSIIAHQVFGNILLLFERAWIVRQFGPEALTIYAIPMTLAMYIHLFASSLVAGVFPALNELVDDRAKLLDLYRKATKVVLALAVFGVVSVAAGRVLFLELWLDEALAAQMSHLLLVHSITFAILAVNTIAWLTAETFRRPGINSIGTFLWMLMAVPLMLTLSFDYQSIGVAYARLAGVMVFIPIIFYLEKRFLNGVNWRFWFRTAGMLSVAGLVALGIESFAFTLGRTWLVFLVANGAGLLTFAGALLAIGFLEQDEKEFLLGLATRRKELAIS